MKISPLIVLLAVLVGYSVGSWMDGLFGGFVAGLCAIPCAGAIQVFVREVRRPAERQGEAGLAETDRKAKDDHGADGQMARTR